MAVDFSMHFNNIHLTATLLGAVVYLGYMMLPTLMSFLALRRSKAEDSDLRCGQPSLAELCRKVKTPRGMAAAIAVLSLFIGLSLSARKSFLDQGDTTSCPFDMDGSYASEPISQAVRPAPAAPYAVPALEVQSAVVEEQGDEADSASLAMKLRNRKLLGRTVLSSPSSDPNELPSALLAQAHASAEASSDRSAGWQLLEACVAWTPPSRSESPPAVTEFYAQLECNGELLEAGATTQEASPALLFRARQLMEMLRANADLSAKVQVEWARITHGVFQLNCKAAVDELQMSRQKKAPGSPQSPSAPSPLGALRSLKRLDGPLREALAALAEAVQILEVRSQSGEAGATVEFAEILKAIGADRSCALQVLQEGRSTALALPRNAPIVKKALQCRPRMLEDFQEFVLREAAQANDAATIFGLGLYYSDVGLAAENGQPQAPFFGARPKPVASWSSEPAWAADLGGTHAPNDVVQAEALMLKGEEASAEGERGDRGAARALRLYQHAKMLALKHHDSAAEWRYRSAAELAAGHRRQKLAAHALGRLGYFLSLRGRKEEGLEAAAEALKHGEEDPLAQYLQVSLRRSLGELKSNEEVHAAEKILAVVAGKLPSKTLEDQRSAAHAELGWWRLVATDGLKVCLRAWDAAQMLICVMSGFVFQMPGAAPQAPAL
jgi:hypothetical protein